MSLYGVNKSGALVVDKASATPYLRRELGLEYYKKRNEALAAGIAAPADFMNKRQLRLDAAAEEAADAYATAFNAFSAAGLDEETCKYNAKQHAKRTFAIQEDYINLEYPETLQNKLLLSTTHGQIGVNDMLGGGAMRQSKTKTRTHKKARKSGK